MTADALLVTGLGHAIMDISARVEENFVAASGLTPGGMTLVDQDTAEALIDRLGEQVRLFAGGSASNTIADLADLGARCGFIGCCADDDRGAAYHDDMCSRGIVMASPAGSSGLATGCSIVLVTPDGQRTMATYPGAAALMQAHHVDGDLIECSDWLFIEAYVFDMPAGGAILQTAIGLQRGLSGGKRALGLSDAGCISRHRDRIEHIIADGIDLAIGNIGEVRAMFPHADDGGAVAMLAESVPVVAVTQGAQDVIVVDHGHEIRFDVSACPVIDTTGAGDCFASGFLYALSGGLDARACARKGHARAARCIGHQGARRQLD